LLNGSRRQAAPFDYSLSTAKELAPLGAAYLFKFEICSDRLSPAAADGSLSPSRGEVNSLLVPLLAWEEARGWSQVLIHKPPEVSLIQGDTRRATSKPILSRLQGFEAVDRQEHVTGLMTLDESVLFPQAL
jgi:hypothetical protein